MGAGGKKKKQSEILEGNHYILSDNQVTTLIWGEVARMREEIVAGIQQYVQDALRDKNHPLTGLLREIVREELAVQQQKASF